MPHVQGESNEISLRLSYMPMESWSETTCTLHTHRSKLLNSNFSLINLAEASSIYSNQIFDDARSAETKEIDYHRSRATIAVLPHCTPQTTRHHPTTVHETKQILSLSLWTLILLTNEKIRLKRSKDSSSPPTQQVKSTVACTCTDLIEVTWAVQMAASFSSLQLYLRGSILWSQVIYFPSPYHAISHE